MKKYLILTGIGIVVWVLIFFVWQYSAQTKNAQSQSIVNFETENNLKSFQPIKGCVKLSKVNSQHTPADIFPSMADCLQKKEYEDAVELYLLSLVYGNFDMKRVSDKTAHQAIMVLYWDYLGIFPEDVISEFDKIKKQIVDSKNFCGKFIEIGYPTYYPTYMIAHGMDSFMEKKSGSNLEKDFDAEAVWDEILKTTLHCTD